MEVDPERLRRVAEAVAESASAVHAAVATRASALAPAASPQLSVVGAAEAAVTAWARFTDRLSGALDGHSATLTAAAEAYATVDQSAAARAVRAGTWSAE